MRQYLLALAILPCAAPLAHASIVQPGSNFDVSLGLYDTQTSQATRYNDLTALSNGTTTFNASGVTGTITESESTLSSGQQQILVSVLGSSDLFSTSSTDPMFGIIGVGVANPIKFSTPFNFGSGLATFYTATGASAAFGFGVQQATPWNGSAAGPGDLMGFSPVTNRGFNRVDITFTSPATVTPEPASFLLSGTGLLGVAGILRRRLSAR